jgi:hypothetical protein
MQGICQRGTVQVFRQTAIEGDDHVRCFNGSSFCRAPNSRGFGQGVSAGRHRSDATSHEASSLDPLSPQPHKDLHCVGARAKHEPVAIGLVHDTHVLARVAS